jgi:lipopolysaccharide transport system ATP-binding protein
MPDIAVEVQDIGKRYRIGNVKSSQPSLNDALIGALTTPFRRVHSLLHHKVPTYTDKEIWALRHISFDVERGDSLGVIGINGSGKSTLLSVIANITRPTEGYVKTRGRLSTLLEVGTGFHDELTGRENLYINGTILGMSRQEIDRVFDQILDFAETEEFIDTPVKRYSTGMRVRLAFSIAVHLRPEIMIFDEVLAVGDIAFREKCMQKIEHVSKDITVIIVSHGPTRIKRLCNRALWLDKGKTVELGDAETVVSNYQRAIMPDTPGGSQGYFELDSDQQKKVTITKIEILGQGGKPTARVESADPLQVHMEYIVNEPVEGVHAICLIEERNEGVTVLGTGDADVTPVRLETRAKGRYVGEFELPPLLLASGIYHLSARLEVPFGEVLDKQNKAVTFRVVDNKSIMAGWYPKPRPGLLGLEIPWEYSLWAEDSQQPVAEITQQSE